MKVISIWSPLHSGTGGTILAAALPVLLASEYRTRTLVIHGGRLGERVEQGLAHAQPGDLSVSAFEETGVGALHRLAATGRLTSDNIQDYTIPLLPHKLDLLPAHPDPQRLDELVRSRLMEGIIDRARRFYDVIIADAGNGTPNAEDLALLRASDLILVGLNQNIRSMEDAFTKVPLIGHAGTDLSDITVGYVVGRYDAESRCTLRNIRRRFGVKEMLEAVPYSTNIADAWNARDLLRCVLRERGGSIRKRETPFYHALRKTAETAAAQLGLPLVPALWKERGA